VKNRLAALGNLDAEVDVNIAWEILRKSITTSIKESIWLLRTEEA
jgi:hypothetical protein